MSMPGRRRAMTASIEEERFCRPFSSIGRGVQMESSPVSTGKEKPAGMTPMTV